jgi:hypothetical protein
MFYYFQCIDECNREVLNEKKRMEEECDKLLALLGKEKYKNIKKKEVKEEEQEEEEEEAGKKKQKKKIMFIFEC